MSTYDPNNPDPVHRIQPRRERVAIWLLALIVILAFIPMAFPVPGWAIVAAACPAAALTAVVFALLLWPFKAQQQATPQQPDDPIAGEVYPHE